MTHTPAHHPALIGIAALAITTLVTLAVLEIMLQFFPVRSYMPFAPVTTQDPVLHYIPHTRQTYSAGWDFDAYNTGTTNAQGYLADYDFDAPSERPVIAVVGDSFIEARMVPFADTLQGRLQRAAGDTAAVYGVGIGGSPLSQYLAFAAMMRDRYHPTFMIVNIVSNDFDESLPAYKNMPRFHYFVPGADGTLSPSLIGEYHPSWIKDLVSKSALVRYAYFHLDLANVVNRIEFMLRAPDDNSAASAPVATATADTLSPDAIKVSASYGAIDAFLRLLPTYAGLPKNRLLLIIDGQRSYIYEDALESEAAQQNYFAAMRRYMIDHARAQGFAMIDMEPVFAADYAAHATRFDFPHDAHWNGYAHGLVAQEVMKAAPVKRLISAAR